MPAWLPSLSHLQQGSGLREYAAIIGEMSGVGPQAWHSITHQSPAEAPSRGGQISNTAFPQPTCMQVRPAVLLDQTPLIETVLFMQENVPHTHKVIGLVLQLYGKKQEGPTLKLLGFESKK